MFISNNTTYSISPGKSILFGEHFVVYGYSSIIFAIDRKLGISINFKNKIQRSNNVPKIRIFTNLGFNAEIIDSKINLSNDSKPVSYLVVDNLYKILNYLIIKNKHENFNNNIDITKIDIDVFINSDIPIGGGLGSSSAFCVSLISSFYHEMEKQVDKKFICDYAIETEKIINENTSGLDCSICTFGGIGIYNKHLGLRKLNCDIHNFPFLIIDTGITHNTFELVEQVKKIKNEDNAAFKNLCNEYENIFESSLKSLENKNMGDLGILMNENHALLKNLNLSNSVIDKIVHICEMGGTFGTKITGAGGGGCILSLIDNSEKKLVSRLLTKLDEYDLKYFFTTPNNCGLEYGPYSSIKGNE